MDNSIKNLTKRVNIQNELGLHARPAALIAAIAQKANSKVWMIRNEEKVDASSIIDILTLACLKGTEVTFQVEDPSDSDVLERIGNLFQNGFGE
ncbi:MAG: HPr family phosphocarrier protein [Desulfobacteraceae bacterium]|nr:MAG: HPr family phosphocarrier protein [Desulfobacteraceae bacterium]